MTTFVLVHGGNMSAATWNRFTVSGPVHTDNGLMGGRVWDPVRPKLEADGYLTFAPTLLDEYSADLNAHIDQITTLITTHDLDDVVLAGHGYGGMIITGVAAAMPERVHSAVYVDAALPEPGQSLFDLIRAGGRDPLTFEGREPAAPYVQRLDYDPAAVHGLPRTYVLCTESEFVVVTNVARDVVLAAAPDEHWTFLELPTWHVPMASMPVEMVEILARAALP